jgi:hypothetical protein
MTRFSWFLCTVLFFGIGCGGTTHVVGTGADGSVGNGGNSRSESGGSSLGGADASSTLDASLGNGGASGGSKPVTTTGGATGSGGSVQLGGTTASASMVTLTGGTTAAGGSTTVGSSTIRDGGLVDAPTLGGGAGSIGTSSGGAGGQSSGTGTGGTGSGGASAGGGGCVTIAGTYTGSEAITATKDITVGGCQGISTGPVVPSAILTITQAAGSCSFTMTNSLASGVEFSGTIDPTTNKMTWQESSSNAPTWPYYGGYLSRGTVDMQITPKAAPQVASLDGSFYWAFSYSQYGMEVCSGTTSLTGYVQ